MFSIRERRQHLLARKRGERREAAEDDGSMSDEPAEEVTDGVLQLKLADIVQQQALAQVPAGKRPGRTFFPLSCYWIIHVNTFSELLYQLWKIASGSGEVAERLETQLYQQLIDHQPPLEEGVIAKLQRERMVGSALSSTHRITTVSCFSYSTTTSSRLPWRRCPLCGWQGSSWTTALGERSWEVICLNHSPITSSPTATLFRYVR